MLFLHDAYITVRCIDLFKACTSLCFAIFCRYNFTGVFRAVMLPVGPADLTFFLSKFCKTNILCMKNSPIHLITTIYIGSPENKYALFERKERGRRSVPRGGKNYFWVYGLKPQGRNILKIWKISDHLQKKNQMKSSIFQSFMDVQNWAPGTDVVKNEEI